MEADPKDLQQTQAFLEGCKQQVVAAGVQPEAVETRALVALLGNSADVGGWGNVSRLAPHGLLPMLGAHRSWLPARLVTAGQAMHPSRLLKLFHRHSPASDGVPTLLSHTGMAGALLGSFAGASLSVAAAAARLTAGREIIRQAEACGCESLVMGSRGLGLSKKALMGLLGVGSGALRAGLSTPGAERCSA